MNASSEKSHYQLLHERGRSQDSLERLDNNFGNFICRAITAVDTVKWSGLVQNSDLCNSAHGNSAEGWRRPLFAKVEDKDDEYRGGSEVESRASRGEREIEDGTRRTGMDLVFRRLEQQLKRRHCVPLSRGYKAEEVLT